MAASIPAHYGEQKTNKGLNEKLISLKIIGLLSILLLATYLLVPDDARFSKLDLGQTKYNLTQPVLIFFWVFSIKYLSETVLK